VPEAGYWAEVAAVEPEGLVALTTTLIVEPASA
jgi:hypothetical protein